MKHGQSLFSRVFAIGCLLVATALPAQTVALTFDDAPALATTPLLSGPARNEALLKVLHAHGLQVAIFANGIDGGDAPEGRKVLAQWGEQGHLVGNHTYSHFNLNKVGLEDFRKDFLRCDDLIKNLPGYTRLLRFPYLKEGDTTEKRDGMREALKASGYRNAVVSVPTFDWLIDQHLRSALKRNPATALEPYRAYYLQHLASTIRRYDGYGKTLAGHNIKLVALLHDTLLNALFLEDVLAMAQKNGFKLVSPLEAYEDPIYATAPRSLTMGESLLWTLAKDRGEPISGLETLNATFLKEEASLQGLGL